MLHIKATTDSNW